MKYDTVIFDLDGTLLNTLDDLAAAVNYALRESGMPQRSVSEVRRFVGSGVKVLMERAVPRGTDTAKTEAALELFKTYYAENSRRFTAPYDGIMQMLDTLKRAGFRMAIVSNKIDFAVKDLQSFFFKGIIDVAVGNGEGMRTKPAPDMVYKAMRALDSTARRCVYVGDSDVDIRTAENAGMDCISVSWGFRGREELAGAGATVIADTAAELAEYLCDVYK